MTPGEIGQLVVAVLSGGALTQLFNYLRATKTDAGELTLKAWVQLKEEQAAWRQELIDRAERLEADLDGKRDEIARLYGKIDQLEERNTELAELLAESNKENEKLRKRVEFLESQPGPGGAVVSL